MSVRPDFLVGLGCLPLASAAEESGTDISKAKARINEIEFEVRWIEFIFWGLSFLFLYSPGSGVRVGNREETIAGNRPGGPKGRGVLPQSCRNHSVLLTPMSVRAHHVPARILSSLTTKVIPELTPLKAKVGS